MWRSERASSAVASASGFPLPRRERFRLTKRTGLSTRCGLSAGERESFRETCGNAAISGPGVRSAENSHGSERRRKSLRRRRKTLNAESSRSRRRGLTGWSAVFPQIGRAPRKEPSSLQYSLALGFRSPLTTRACGVRVPLAGSGTVATLSERRCPFRDRNASTPSSAEGSLCGCQTARPRRAIHPGNHAAGVGLIRRARA